RGDHVLGIAAVIGDPGDLASLAGKEVTAAAVIAMPAVAAIPADTHPLASLPTRYVSTDGINHAGYFVPRNARVGDAGILSFKCERVRVTDPACRDANPDPAGRGHCQFPLDEFQLARCGHFSGAICIHCHGWIPQWVWRGDWRDA